MRLGSTHKGREPYLVVVGVVVGLLLGGLALPLVRGDRTVTASTDLASTDVGDDLGAEDGAVDGDGTGPGSATGDPSAQPGANGGGPGATTPSTRPGDRVDPTTLTATDVGVTATEIRLGMLIMDLGSAGQLGFSFPGFDPATQRKVYEAYIAEVNEAGGVNGRRIVPVFENYDATNRDDMLRACAALKDKKVFAVLGQFTFSDPVLCITKRHGIPYIAQMTQGLPTQLLRESRGMLFSLVPSAPRTMKSFAGELHRTGHIGNLKVGIFADKFFDPEGTESATLERELQARGYTVVHKSLLTDDPDTAATEVPLQVDEMERKGARVVLLLTNSLSSQNFVQMAESRQYRPKYAVTDYGSMATDGNTSGMTSSFDGAMAVTSLRVNESRTGLPEPPAAVACRQVAEQRTGQAFPRDQGSYYAMTQECAMFRVFQQGATAAGAALTRARLSAAIQRSGNVAAVEAMVGGGAFAPGKFDFSDYVRAARWEYACKCWKPAGEFGKVAG